MEHPDASLKVGTTREAAGLKWTLYKNQFGIAWKAGILANNIKAHGKGSYRLEDKLVTYATFEKVAQAARDQRAKEYTAAKALVEAFEVAVFDDA